MKLTDFIEENSTTRAAFARQIGTSRQAVNRYCAGDRFPTKKIMTRIWEQTHGHVTADDFMDLPE